MNITYKDEGQGEVILLIHGFCGSSEYWNEVIPSLASVYRVIAIDLPGHGDSADQPALSGIEDYATCIKDFLEALHIDRVTMFGHSLGGYITLAFAEMYGSRLNGFSLVHSTALPDSEEAQKGREASAEKIDKEGMEAFIDGLVLKLFSPSSLESLQVDVKEIGNITSSEGAKRALHAMKTRKDRRYILENTTLPVLLVAGEDDQLIPPEKTFTSKGVNIKQVLVSGVGHMSMYEKPEELVRSLVEFMK
ncbi:alpha/beta hydrolase [Psychrobacillus sp.]|uniref:alpha/beta fold hydrolase n=1 Tax=Psychrobacillus sp. TaxID=1871623 RepID=UPI0028BDED4E|nr:alpha/beta hydrolase [Psychrobacillus sp.]